MKTCGLKKMSKWRSLRQQDGFTIVELIVVIAIVSIMTGVVSVSVDQVNQDTRLSNAANRALADVRYAQELAMAHRRQVDVYVTTGSSKYEVKWADTGAYVPSPLDGENMIVQFGAGQYSDVSIVSTGVGGKLSFSVTGEPLVGGAPFGDQKSIMFLNSRIHVIIYPSGYSCLEEIVGGGSGCDGA